ncbi:MAG: hypothetical protein MHM6MM_006588 [Cercozoa sp. M6MM]
MRAPYPQLRNEYRCYKILAGESGIPRVYWTGQSGEYRIMVMQKLNEDLECLFNRCNRRLSYRSVLLLALSLVNRLKSVHQKGLVHCDIKPDNFLIKKRGHVESVRGQMMPVRDKIYMIDFGLSEYFIDPSTNSHRRFSRNGDLVGTARYASCNSHHGLTYSRRDDLESVGYLLVYFLKGRLPWQGLKQRKAKKLTEQFCAIREVKEFMTPAMLCEGLPQEFAQYIEYCRNLRYSETPDYNFIQRLFHKLFLRRGYDSSAVFDWQVEDPTRLDPNDFFQGPEPGCPPQFAHLESSRRRSVRVSKERVKKTDQKLLGARANASGMHTEMARRFAQLDIGASRSEAAALDEEETNEDMRRKASRQYSRQRMLSGSEQETRNMPASPKIRVSPPKRT